MKTTKYNVGDQVMVSINKKRVHSTIIEVNSSGIYRVMGSDSWMEESDIESAVSQPLLRPQDIPSADEATKVSESPYYTRDNIFLSQDFGGMIKSASSLGGRSVSVHLNNVSQPAVDRVVTTLSSLGYEAKVVSEPVRTLKIEW